MRFPFPMLAGREILGVDKALSVVPGGYFSANLWTADDCAEVDGMVVSALPGEKVSRVRRRYIGDANQHPRTLGSFYPFVNALALQPRMSEAYWGADRLDKGRTVEI